MSAREGKEWDRDRQPMRMAKSDTERVKGTHIALPGHTQCLSPVEVEVAAAVALARKPVVEAAWEVRVVLHVGVVGALHSCSILRDPGVQRSRTRLAVAAAKVVVVG